MPCPSMRRLAVKARCFSAACYQLGDAQSHPFLNTTRLTSTTTQHAYNPATRRHLSHSSDDSHSNDPHHHHHHFHFNSAAATDRPRTPGVRRFYPPTNGHPEEKAREEMRVSGYAVTIEGLCGARRVDAAMKVLDEMRVERLEPHVSTCCDPIVGALSAEGRLDEALGLIERYPLYGVAPDVSTYNLLVRGFCKRRDVDGANKVLKLMAHRGLTPTPTTYNHFLWMFSRSREIDAAVNLYNKLVRSGFALDRLTHRMLIESLHRGREFQLAVKVTGDMKRNGFDLDLKTSTMLVQMLCNLRRFDEACTEFEAMIRKGKVPWYSTYRRLLKDLKRVGMEEMAGRILRIMREALRSGKLPVGYWEREGEERPYETRRATFEKAKAMSEALKVSRERKRAEESRARRRFEFSRGRRRGG